MIYAEMTGTDIALIIVGAILVVALITLLVLVIVYFRRRRNEEREEKVDTQKEETNNTKELLDFKDSITDSFNKRFTDLETKLSDTLNQTSQKTEERMKEVNAALEKISVTQTNLEKASQDVLDLRVVLEGNQTRGQYGEMQLASILQRYFGEPSDGTYKEQYVIKKSKDGNDVRADAVVFLPNDLFICVDSKFPFPAYQKLFETKDEGEKEKLKAEFATHVKKHIKDISSKYIVEGITFPHAIMFIPNDGIDSFIHGELPDVIDYAYENKVILTSPRVLGPLLMEIRMLKQEETRNKLAKQLTVELNNLGKQFRLFSGEWSTFTNRVDGLGKDVDKINKRVDNINNRFEKIEQGELGIVENKEITVNDSDNE